jgi:hypothetical protein
MKRNTPNDMNAARIVSIKKGVLVELLFLIGFLSPCLEKFLQQVTPNFNPVTILLFLHHTHSTL